MPLSQGAVQGWKHNALITAAAISIEAVVSFRLLNVFGLFRATIIVKAFIRVRLSQANAHIRDRVLLPHEPHIWKPRLV